MKSLSELTNGATAGDIRAEPTGFRWYLQSSLPVSWLARDVIPALRYLRQEGMPVVTIRRGWLHGTHLEVIAHCDGVRPVPWPQVLAKLRAPAQEDTYRQSEEAYLARARELGRLEHVPGPYLPIQPHGTFEWLASSDLRPWPGISQPLRERALTRMLDALTASLGQEIAADKAPVPLVAEIMLAVADAHPARIPYGTLSFRSHGEAFLNWLKATSDPRPDFERRLAADRPVLRPLAERMLAGTDSRAAAAWRRVGIYCMGLFDSAGLAGSVSMETIDQINEAPDGAPERKGPPGTPDATPGKSEFHQAVDASGLAERSPGWFVSYRLVLNLLYSQLPLLGVSPRQRFYLCWALAEVVDEITGETWRDRLARGVSVGTTGGQK